ncbi:hypothetical protein [Pseudotenacibaculum haliotis]|uniref:Lipoprotein n=1 Tax=Pseudotenacibaculum haliotis TaxID=1862138 RepID=A0ABW5LTV3_9FLAO
MKKITLLVIALSFIWACQPLNPHLIKNDFKWKRKKFKTPTPLYLKYDPVYIKQIDTLPHFLGDYAKNDRKLNALHDVLVKKLKARNFVIDTNSNLTLSIDTIFLSEKSSFDAFYDANNEYLGDEETTEVDLKIVGTLQNSSSKHTVFNIYHFISEPKQSFLFPSFITQSNSWTDMKIVWGNLMNKFSYHVYRTKKKKME